jgi:hypothetical protein
MYTGNNRISSFRFPVLTRDPQHKKLFCKCKYDSLKYVYFETGRFKGFDIRLYTLIIMCRDLNLIIWMCDVTAV